MLCVIVFAIREASLRTLPFERTEWRFLGVGGLRPIHTLRSFRVADMLSGNFFLGIPFVQGFRPLIDKTRP